jgi:hypothetical protein
MSLRQHLRAIICVIASAAATPAVAAVGGAAVEVPRPAPMPHAARAAEPPRRLAPLPMGKVMLLAPQRLPVAGRTHEDLARSFEEKATTYHQVAQVQRDLLALLKVEPTEGSSARAGQVTALQRHAAQLIRDADRLAADAQRSADYQRSLVRQLRGR